MSRMWRTFWMSNAMMLAQGEFSSWLFYGDSFISFAFFEYFFRSSLGDRYTRKRIQNSS